MEDETKRILSYHVDVVTATKDSSSFSWRARHFRKLEPDPMPLPLSYRTKLLASAFFSFSVISSTSVSLAKETIDRVSHYKNPPASGKLSKKTPIARSDGSSLPKYVTRRSGAMKSGLRKPAFQPQQEAIIVTGTHAGNRRVYDSVSPISVITSQSLRQTGQLNLIDAIVRLDPSISSQQVGKGGASLASTLRMRGLSPNEVLVLVDGKRRHSTATISTSSGLEKGSNGVDLNMIPTSAVDHIEVLRDGAAAMYGSDAIAGVINIVLKKKATGFSISAQTGANAYNGDGWQTQVNLGYGITFGNNGFFRIDGQYTHADHMIPTTSDVGAPVYHFPANSNHINSTPEETRGNLAISFGADLNDHIRGYGNIIYSHRHNEAYENYRYPNALPALYPYGYSPSETNDENDYSATLGLKGDNLLGWNWDLSTTYGADISRIGTINTANVDLYKDTGYTPTSTMDTRYSLAQWTNNFDVKRDFSIAHAIPVTVAAGAEHRLETYQLWAGDPASYELGGAQGYGGLMPSNAGKWSRDIWAGYLDGDFHFTRKWEVDFAGRFEHYTDGSGNTETGKVSTRYNFTKRFAIRGTFSNGFEAPSLLQEHFSSTNTSVTSASALLSPNSPGGRYLGGQNLKPERSTSAEAGVILEPIDRLHFSLDVYQINIRDRIYVGSSTYGETAAEAITLSGAALPTTVSPSQVSAYTFANVGSTRTQGLDIRSEYSYSSPRFGTFTPSLALSLTKTTLQHTNTDSYGSPYLNAQTASYLTSSSPRSKLILQLHWNYTRWDATIRQTRYGQTTDMLTYEDQTPASATCKGQPLAYSNSCWSKFTNTPAWLTDLEVGYRPLPDLHVAIGANNIFNVRPRKVPLDVNYHGASPYDLNSSGISFTGGYYYGRVDLTL